MAFELISYARWVSIMFTISSTTLTLAASSEMDYVKVKLPVGRAQFDVATVTGQSRKPVDGSVLLVVGLLECRDSIQIELIPLEPD